jgi:hypothetical protein
MIVNKDGPLSYTGSPQRSSIGSEHSFNSSNNSKRFRIHVTSGTSLQGYFLTTETQFYFKAFIYLMDTIYESCDMGTLYF